MPFKQEDGLSCAACRNALMTFYDQSFVQEYLDYYEEACTV